MTRLHRYTAAFASALLLALACPSLVHAQGTADQAAAKATAMKLYEEATTKYNIGEWDEAVRLYKEAYGAFPAPEFLFNIGQSYRQKNDCKNGLFFYKRYLANKPDAANREQVEGFIRDLETMCKNQDQVRDKPPSNPVPPDGSNGGGSVTTGATGGTATTGAATTTTTTTTATDTATSTGSAATSGGDMSVVAVANAPTGLVAMHAEAGLGIVSMGDLETTSQMTIKLGAGYPLAFGPIGLEVGGAATFTTLQWETLASDTGTALLWSMMANARGSYHLAAVQGLSLEAELGLGILTFSGLEDEAAPIFLEPGKIADGSPSMFHLRIAVGAAYEIMPGIAVTLQPLAFAYSPTADGFLASSINRFDFLAGVVYRL